MGESAVKITERETVTEIAIGGPMILSRIDELRDGLVEAFRLGKNMRVSLQAVTEVDVTGLQLLCSAHKTSMVKNLDFSVIGGENKILSLVAKQAGMLRHVGCCQDICITCVWKKEG